MKRNLRLAAVLFAFLFALGAALPAYAASAEKEEYTYTVRFLAGAQGTIDGEESVVYTGLHYGDRIVFRQNRVQPGNDSKYYVRGIRESGKDNSTVTDAASFTVTGDADYVVAYGLRGDIVAYTVNYTDVNGNELAPSETYYGNVGDRPVVAFQYFDGWQPQAYNLTGTLQKNEGSNVFTFTYTRVEDTLLIPPADLGENPGGVLQPGQGAVLQPNPDIEQGGNNEPDQPANDPDEVENIDGPDTPLSPGVSKDSALVSAKDFAVLMFNMPMGAKAGIISFIVLAGGAIFYFVAFRKRKKHEDEQKAQ